MRAYVLVVLAACGSTPGEQADPLVFERQSPLQATSHDVFVAAHGDVIVLGHRISLDGGATWEPSPLTGVARVAIDGTTVAAFTDRLVRYEVGTGQLATVADAPPYASERTWRIARNGRFIVFDPVHDVVAFETQTGWVETFLPQPSPGEVDPYITDVETNGTFTLAVSAWGVYRFDGYAWDLVLPQAPGLGRELVALSDAQFVLLGGATTYRFDTQGRLAGESPGISVETEEALACDAGAVVARGKLSRDAGATWQSIGSGGALALTIERVGCSTDRYFLQGHSPAWGYRLLRYDTSIAATRQGAPGIAIGNWEAGGARWAADGPPIVRTIDGTLIAAGLAWREGELTWSLREAPARAWAAGETLFGIADGKFYTSDDAGRTWRATTIAGLDRGEIEAFARSPDGALHASRFVGDSEPGLDEWQSTVWRSGDGGTSWAEAYDARATRETGKHTVGEVHRFVGITSAGAWIATDAISHDDGATWHTTAYDGDTSLGFVTPDGHLVTARGDEWHVFEAGGLGDRVATWQIEVDGETVPASQLRSVAFDDDGYAYVARGTPYVAVWRSTRPITH